MKAREVVTAVALSSLLIVSVFGAVSLTLPKAYAAPRAAILSPLEFIEPMAFLNDLTSLLTASGFAVDVLKNEQVTVDFFKTQLVNYKIIILRTEAYDWAHVTYWYLGEFTTSESPAKYAADIAAKRLNFASFTAGFTARFITDYYKSNPMPGSFVFMVASNSLLLASAFKTGGASVFVGYWKPLNFGFGLVDDLTKLVIFFMAKLQLSVRDAVRAVIDIFMQRAFRFPNETSAIPPLAYSGNGSQTLSTLAGN